MTEPQKNDPVSPMPPNRWCMRVRTPRLEEYAGGIIQARVGYIPIWLLVVYAVLFIWALYYMVVYWGGLGPGRIE